MTISSSMNASVAGLNANATRLATISDNIANSGTYGYKRADATFESFVITGSQGSGTYSAGGVRAITSRNIIENGGLVGTSNATDLAVSGRGMLPVSLESSIENAGETPFMMTTTGSFNLNEDGYLTTDSGLVLLGWPADRDGIVPNFPRDSITGLQPVQVSAQQLEGNPTTQLNLGINLPAQHNNDVLTSSIEYFGNLGSSETLSVTFTPTAPNAWDIMIEDSAQGNAVIGEFALVFDDTRGNGGTLLSVTPQGANPAGAVYDPVEGSLSLNVAGGPLSVTIGKPGDVESLTQLSDIFAPTRINKDGSPIGNMTALNVDGSGNVIATYDTGFSNTLYQIPLVDVPNPNGLRSLDYETYQVGSDSGAFFLWDAGTGPTGTVSSFTREGSTTDVAAELTDLIQTQRAYSSNAKVIQTVDEMLQETTNIKR